MGAQLAHLRRRQLHLLTGLRFLAAVVAAIGLGLILGGCDLLGEDDTPGIDRAQAESSADQTHADTQVVWEQGVDDLMQGLLTTMAAHSQFTEEFATEIQSGDLTPVLDTGWSTGQSFVFLVDKARSLPSPPEVAQANAALVRTFELFVAAYDDYLAAIETGDFGLIEQGEQKFQQAHGELLTVAPEIDGALGRGPVAPLPGALGVIVTEIKPALQAASRMDDEFVAELGDGAPELVREKAVEVRDTFAAILDQIEELPPVQRSEVEAAIADLREGVRLVGEAYEGYVEILDGSTERAPLEADYERQEGFILIVKAQKRLLEFFADLNQS